VMLAEHCCLSSKAASLSACVLRQTICYLQPYWEMQISSTTGTFSYWHKIKRRTMSVLSNHFAILYLPIPNKEPSINDMEFCPFVPNLFSHFLSIFSFLFLFFVFLGFPLFHLFYFWMSQLPIESKRCSYLSLPMIMQPISFKMIW